MIEIGLDDSISVTIGEHLVHDPIPKLIGDIGYHTETEGGRVEVKSTPMSVPLGYVYRRVLWAGFRGRRIGVD